MIDPVTGGILAGTMGAQLVGSGLNAYGTKLGADAVAREAARQAQELRAARASRNAIFQAEMRARADSGGQGAAMLTGQEQAANAIGQATVGNDARAQALGLSGGQAASAVTTALPALALAADQQGAALTAGNQEANDNALMDRMRRIEEEQNLREAFYADRLKNAGRAGESLRLGGSLLGAGGGIGTQLAMYSKPDAAAAPAAAPAASSNAIYTPPGAARPAATPATVSPRFIAPGPGGYATGFNIYQAPAR